MGVWGMLHHVSLGVEDRLPGKKRSWAERTESYYCWSAFESASLHGLVFAAALDVSTLIRRTVCVYPILPVGFEAKPQREKRSNVHTIGQNRCS